MEMEFLSSEKLFRGRELEAMLGPPLACLGRQRGAAVPGPALPCVPAAVLALAQMRPPTCTVSFILLCVAVFLKTLPCHNHLQRPP